MCIRDRRHVPAGARQHRADVRLLEPRRPRVTRLLERQVHGHQPRDRVELGGRGARRQRRGAERDRALSLERKAQARTMELRAQARQIIEDKKVAGAGDSEYRFTADGAIRAILVSDDQRRQLSSGLLVIVRHGERHELLPRAAGDKVRERDPGMVVLDHGPGADAGPAPASSDDDAYYAQFQVPDDLVW